MYYIATFFTHSGAMKYNNFLKSINIHAELMPVPRKFSSNCGIAAKFSPDIDISSLISDDIEKLYKIDDTGSHLIYNSD